MHDFKVRYICIPAGIRVCVWFGRLLSATWHFFHCLNGDFHMCSKLQFFCKQIILLHNIPIKQLQWTVLVVLWVASPYLNVEAQIILRLEVPAHRAICVASFNAPYGSKLWYIYVCLALSTFMQSFIVTWMQANKYTKLWALECKDGHVHPPVPK